MIDPRNLRRALLAAAVATAAVVASIAPVSAAPPLLRFNSITIQSDIIGYYREALNRAPDLGGFRTYVGAAASNCFAKLGNSGVNIFKSPEFLSRNLSNRTKVEVLYRGLMNRNGDAGGIDNWTNYLNSGQSWSSAVDSFSSSSEYANRVTYICYVHYGSSNRLFISEANGLLYSPFFTNSFEFLRQRELRMAVANPYNWAVDGCSGPTYDAALLYDSRVCWRHDWGYRNYGSSSGLQMERTETRREAIDSTLYADALESCETRWRSGPTYALCTVDAQLTYSGVRIFGSGAFFS